MYYSLLLVSALLSVCTPSGESTVNASPQNLHGPVKIQALAGSFAVLPCAVNNTSLDFPTTVEWSKQGLKDGIVFLYRDGCETPEMKNPAFEYRTSFNTKVLENDISLRISDVQLSDAGTYLCKKLWKDSPPDITTVELDVATVSEPRLSVVSGESVGVTVQCEVSCWLPEPDILFLDDRRNELHAEEAKRKKGAGGCYTVKRRVTLQAATISVTCIVQEQQFNQSRDAEIYMPANRLASSCQTWIIIIIVLAAGGWVLFLALSVVCLYKKFCKSAEEHKRPVTWQSSSASTDTDASEKQSLLEQKNSIVDQLTKENARLKSELHKAKSQLQGRNKCQVVCQLDQPTIDSSTPSSINPPRFSNQPQSICPKPKLKKQVSNPGPSRPIRTTHRNSSSPDLVSGNAAALSASSSTACTAESKPRRSMSDPNSHMPQRRRSFGTSPSFLSNNPYGPLAKLNEDSEVFLS